MACLLTMLQNVSIEPGGDEVLSGRSDADSYPAME